jgi:hypothetical protein
MIMTDEVDFLDFGISEELVIKPEVIEKYVQT